MARKNNPKPRNIDQEDPYGLNEVDDFAKKREKVLLSESTFADRDDSNDDVLNIDEEEEEVMAVSDGVSESEEEEEEEEEGDELNGAEAYRKVFGRNLDLGDDNEEAQDNMLDNENAWGSTKAEYYGADDMADDETAKEIEKEALRQQRKHLQDLNMNDYLDDVVEEEWVKDANAFDIGEFKDSTKQDDKNVSMTDLMNMDKDAKKAYLKTMFPEFLPLSKELAQLSPILDELKAHEETEFIKLKVIALSSYLGTIVSYFGILLHELNNNEDFSTMQDHSIMESILTSKEVWRQASELPNDIIDENMSAEDEAVNETKMVNDDDDSAVEYINIDNNEDPEEGEEEDNDDEESDVDIDDFVEYVTQSRVSKKKNDTNKEKIDDFIESEMADVDAQDKSIRKKTLRFYTSKIDQQAGKKNERFKGDDDIPYKERLFERQQRLLEEARKRGMHDKNGADLNSNDLNSDDEATLKTINNSGDKDYYKQILRSKEEKKNNRAQAHTDAVKAAREGKLAELAEELGEGGKRAINYQILKNKGLTPKRKKENRNSRVKKRKKYEVAQKKLKSVRAVYSGGQNGVYEGEKTGIKKNLSRSVRFKN